MSGPTLNERLEELGYTTVHGVGVGQKHVLRDGEVVFTGRAYEVWAWLRETHP